MLEHQTQICFIQAILNQLGVVAICETDWPGGISAAMLAGASRYRETSVLLDDTTTLANGKKLMWHCGNCVACKRSGCLMKMGQSWILPMPGAGYINTKLMEPGDWVTMARLTRNSNGTPFMLTYEAPVVEGPDTRGGYFWVQPEDPFMLQFRLRRYRGTHHWGVIRGQLSHIIDQTCDQLGINCYSLNTEGEKAIERRLACVEACEAMSGTS
jgi:L-fucose isomerase-like protein